jgi:FkbM family methyltransferase
MTTILTKARKWRELPRWLKQRRISLAIRLRGRARFRDKYGGTYYLWANTRPMGTVVQGVRTDDEGVLHQLGRIIETLKPLGRPIVCVDVGAFIGVITLYMATRLRTTDHVHSFEPNRVTYQRLLANIALNRLDNVTAYNLAVAERQAEVPFLPSADQPGTSMIVDTQAPPPTAAETVRTHTLAALAAELGIDAIDILKIDAEGYDAAVLRGAGDLLTSGRIHYIIVEDWQ